MPKKSLMPILKRLTVIGVIALIFFVVAFSSGIGYEASLHITSERLVVNPNSPGLYGDFIITGDINVSLNGFLYPISYASGNGRIQRTFNVTLRNPSIRGVIPENTVKEAATVKVVSPEITKNLAYFFMIAFGIEFVLEKFINVLMKPFRLKESP